VPVGHVEAGLRTHDPAQPWPEEEYRRQIDAEAELLFAPTELAASNLRNENVRGAIHVTGNTGIDAVLRVESLLPDPGVKENGKFRLLVTCHRRENWGAGVCALAAALTELARDPDVRIELVIHPNVQLAGMMTRLFADHPEIRLHPPAGHSKIVGMMRDSDLVLSDSGGVQEEAPALGVPLLVLRDKTERPEAIATGNMRLVGCRAGEIVSAVRALRADLPALAAMSGRSFPYGDGRAGPRIAAIVEDWVTENTVLRRRAV
jgi:UDP-N-acetylglucosamine 2-epimerase (non-hydrolysing)